MKRFLSDQTKAVFKSWEYLRILYNGILIALSCFFIVDMLDDLIKHVHWPVFISAAVMAAIAANVCYFIGPIVEAYLTWIGWRFTGLRAILFTAGLLFSMLVVTAVFTAIHFDDMAIM